MVIITNLVSLSNFLTTYAKNQPYRSITTVGSYKKKKKTSSETTVSVIISKLTPKAKERHMIMLAFSFPLVFSFSFFF